MIRRWLAEFWPGKIPGRVEYIIGICQICQVQEAGLDGLFSSLLIADRSVRYNGQDHLRLSSNMTQLAFASEQMTRAASELEGDGLRGLMNVCVEVSAMGNSKRRNDTETTAAAQVSSTSVCRLDPQFEAFQAWLQHSKSMKSL